ncbi:MAG: galactose-1-phosphate uridylyltransferase [Chloroflexi bacterium]|nr:galactose-1-phosphate uridylyltransferase [Chloroflexota bacterium]
MEDVGLPTGELAALVADRPPSAGPELRWNPLRGEWTIVAAQRMDRPLTTAGDHCLLCPGGPEMPEAYTIACFENRFPSLLPNPPGVPATPRFDAAAFATTPAAGVCEVVMYAPEHDASLSTLPVGRVARLLDVLADRCRELAALPGVELVYPFENRGAAVGVTLHHPHGQIYAFPYLPPVLELEWSRARTAAAVGGCLFCTLIAAEQADGRRIIAESRSFLAVVPFAARYPYEVHVLARRHGATSLADLDRAERADLAAALALVTRKYDNLYGFPLPYMMVFHQAPLRARQAADRWHLHVEFYPPMRSRDKLKYRASVETGAGSFINDSYPEEKAAELRALPPRRLADLSREGGDREEHRWTARTS